LLSNATCTATLRALLTHCVDEGYMSSQDAEGSLRLVEMAGSFDAEGIRDALTEVADEC
jgi:hypothetical protein